MTIYGLILLLFTLGCSVAAFISYFREPDGLFLVLVIAVILVVAGVASILSGTSQGISEILLFQAKAIYPGMAWLACGVGFFVGTLSARLTLCVRHIFKKT
jgi:hypothetical protein